MDLRLRRLDILRRVESGELSLEDGNQLLFELEEREGEAADLPGSGKMGDLQIASGDIPNAEVEINEASAGEPASFVPVEPEPGSPPPGQTAKDESPSAKMTSWRGLWVVSFLLGLLLTLVSANWMYLGLVSAGLSWGFWLSFIPFAIGVLLMWASWQMRLARWLHLHIRQRPGVRPQVIAFSLPLPIGLTRWVIQRFGRFSPSLNGQDGVEILEELDQVLAADDPMHVFVDGEDGQQVEIWVEGPAKK